MNVINLSPDNLIPNDVEISASVHEGYESIRLVLTPDAETPDNPTFAQVKDLEFHNGIIKVEVAGRPLSDAPPQARGFIGIAFRIQDDLSAFECMYLRPTNGRAEQQLRRNRATQYFSYPDWKFDRMRTEAPGHYESYVDLITGTWTKMRIEVEAEKAKLFVHDNDQPTIIVNDLKHGPKLKGGIGLYIDNGTEGFFKNLEIDVN